MNKHIIIYGIVGVLMSAAALGKQTFQVTSSFSNGQPLNPIHSLKGGNEVPTLHWSGAPKETKTFAIIVDDPDAPSHTWVHWVVYNIPASEEGIAGGLGRKRSLPNGTMQGINDFKQIGYDGPQPPPGKPHRYFFKVYALDKALDIPAGATKAALEKAMKGHVLASAQLIGTFATIKK